MRRVLIGVLLVAALLTAGNAPAQQTITVPTGVQLTVVFDHDRRDTDKVSGVIDLGAIVTSSLAAQPSTGPLSLTFPPVTAGAHALDLWATGPLGDGPRTLISFAAGSKPSAVCASGKATLTVGPGGSFTVDCQ